MRINFISKILLLLLITGTSAFAQLDKANRYYDDKEYSKAIKLYENILRKSENPEALERIANSYRIVKNYTQAENYYSRLMKLPNIEAINHYYYGLVLKSNGKIDEAKDEFQFYANAVPSDKKAALMIKACADFETLSNKSKQVEVSPMADINTSAAEFSPVLFKNQLVFVSDRTPSLTSDKHNYLHIYHINLKKEADVKNNKAEAFPWPVNSDFHDGPATFNGEQNQMVISHVDLYSKTGKKFVNRSKIFFLTLDEKKWSKLTSFQYNSDDYSLVHPSLSADGQKLFFASDMPGGEGGMDIYMSEKQGDTWTTPKNLGNKVNTAGEEVFPYIRKDGMLFFSSDGHSGLGGLDAFVAKPNEGKYGDVKNMGASLNSSADDFGIVFNDDNLTGYFSSDRLEGKGSDDIYSFTIVDKSIDIVGTIVINRNPNNPLKNSKISLLKENGTVLTSTTTTKTGAFKFEDLDSDKNYMIKLDDAKDEKIKYHLLNDKNKFIRETGSKGLGGVFVFRDLPAAPDELLAVTDGKTVAGNLLVEKNGTKPLAFTKVNLVDENGVVVQTVVTNAFGSFVFTDLPPDKNYMVRVEEKDVSLPKNSKIILTNKGGKEVKTQETGETGGFKFEFLAADKKTMKLMEVEDVDLKIDFKGKFVGDNKSPIANSKVNLVNDKGEILQTTTTDEFGTFKFENLPADQHVMFLLDEKDPQLKKMKKIVLSNSNGDVVKEVKASEVEGTFQFNILPSEKNKLGVVYVDDPWLKVLKLKTSTGASKGNLTIVEKVYYGYGEYRVLPEAEIILDKVIDLMEKDPKLIIEI
jgi:hypothetical protein